MSSKSHNHINEESCQCHKSSTAAQSLDEMEFERGIWTAALYNDIEELKKFIGKGCVNNRDNSGYTALHYSSRKGYYEACKLLIENGANLNAVTNGGVSSLHRACMMGHENIVNLLLSKNACTLTRDEDGQTALHRAAVNGHIRIVEILLKNNENLKFIRDFKDQTPYDLVSDDFLEIKSLLSL